MCSRPPRAGGAGRSGRRAGRWSGVWSRSGWNTHPVLSLVQTTKEQIGTLLQFPVKRQKYSSQIRETSVFLDGKKTKLETKTGLTEVTSAAENV